MTGTSNTALSERRQSYQRGSLSDSDWEKYREIITQMYSDHPLREVVSKMASEHNFIATKRMYKSRFSRWGLNKNMKSHEMEALVRHVQRDASSGAAVLQIRGKAVPLAKVERFARKHKRDLAGARSPTPNDLNIPSPSISQGYALVSIVQTDVEDAQPPTDNDNEKVTSAETVNMSNPSSGLAPLLPRPILNEPIVESPRQDALYVEQVTNDASTPGASVGQNATGHSPVAGPSGNSISGIRESRGNICRCKIHTDTCDRSQFISRAERCVGCQRFFSWTKQAQLYIAALGGDFLCRCAWHDRACRKLQEDFDARRCQCCRGWFAFSEQADPLIKMYADIDFSS